jgi:hypothetical protein
MRKTRRAVIVFAVLLLCLSVVPAEAQANVVSLGKTYQFITDVSEGYPDSAEYKLTNGVYASPVETGETSFYYKSEEYVGLNQSAVDENGNFVLVLDLDSVMNDLSAFEISYLNETDIGIFAPDSVTFYVSETRNGDYVPVGTIDINEPTTAGISESKTAVVTPDGPVAGQFIMIEIKHLGSYVDDEGVTRTAGWVFLDEISVYGAEEESPDQSPDESPEESPVESPDTSPETSPDESVPEAGDNMRIISASILAVASVLMILGIIRKRRYGGFKKL